MGQAISGQHPAVGLRSRYNRLRGLLPVTLIAIGGLAGTVVILAVEDDRGSRSPAAARDSVAGPPAARPTPDRAFPGLGRIADNPTVFPLWDGRFSD